MAISFRVSFTLFYGTSEKSHCTFYFPGKRHSMINCYEEKVRRKSCASENDLCTKTADVGDAQNRPIAKPLENTINFLLTLIIMM